MLHKHDESLISAGHRVEFWKLLTPNRAWVHLSDRERRTKRVSEKEPSQSLSFLAPISSLNFFFFFLFKRLKGAQKAGPRKSAVFLLLARRDGLKGHPPSRTPPSFSGAPFRFHIASGTVGKAAANFPWLRQSTAQRQIRM